jgi:hypothetical protein
MRNGARKFRPDNRGDRFPMVDTGLNYCLTPRCGHTVNKKRCHSPFCSRCRSRNFRRDHPAMAHYLDLKNRARQRGHEFTITFEYYYKTVWLDSGYAERHGKTKECLSVDRLKNNLGYVPGNLNVLTVSENARKQDRKQFVAFFRRQIENAAYKPTVEEIASVAHQLA